MPLTFVSADDVYVASNLSSMYHVLFVNICPAFFPRIVNEIWNNMILPTQAGNMSFVDSFVVVPSVALYGAWHLGSAYHVVFYEYLCLETHHFYFDTTVLFFLFCFVLFCFVRVCVSCCFDFCCCLFFWFMCLLFFIFWLFCYIKPLFFCFFVWFCLFVCLLIVFHFSVRFFVCWVLLNFICTFFVWRTS